MFKYLTLPNPILQKWRVWMIIDDVPPEDAFCEFEFEKSECHSHLEKAQPEGFQYIGDGRAMASPRSELATSPSAGPRRTVSYKPQTLPSIVGTCRKSFPKSAASSEPTI